MIVALDEPATNNKDKDKVLIALFSIIVYSISVLRLQAKQKLYQAINNPQFQHDRL
ncbi:hypothetical protein GCM10025767_14320 [Thalassotalea piscium]